MLLANVLLPQFVSLLHGLLLVLLPNVWLVTSCYCQVLQIGTVPVTVERSACYFSLLQLDPLLVVTPSHRLILIVRTTVTHSCIYLLVTVTRYNYEIQTVPVNSSVRITAV